MSGRESLCEARRWTNAEILEALMEGMERASHFTFVPKLSDNFISGLDLDGSKPKLILSLANGQHFEITAKRLAS